MGEDFLDFVSLPGVSPIQVIEVFTNFGSPFASIRLLVKRFGVFEARRDFCLSGEVPVFPPGPR